ncbi:unnamed protein product, partial [marine sediment metagenome]
ILEYIGITVFNPHYILNIFKESPEKREAHVIAGALRNIINKDRKVRYGFRDFHEICEQPIIIKMVIIGQDYACRIGTGIPAIFCELNRLICRYTACLNNHPDFTVHL